VKVPGKIDLTEYEYNRDSSCCNGHWDLARLLQNWVGPRYRLYDSCNLIQFLSIEVYGTSGRAYDSKESHLLQRYSDYKYVVRGGRHLLLCPYYMGASWYGAVLEIITKDIQEWVDWKNWWNFWTTNFWFFKAPQNKTIFEGLANDFVWEKWSEGIALMNF
jgi:hypothetical protein